MRTFLLALILVLTGLANLNGQNVMSHLDPVLEYNPAAAVGSPDNPAVPAADVLTKWVRDPRRAVSKSRINWNQNRFKCYYWNGMAFRLRFPKNYNPSGTQKYPLMLFMHGLCESQPGSSPSACPPSCTGIINRENQDQLFWGAQLFDQRIESDQWNGFLLFPQQRCEQAAGWDISMFEPINRVLDTLEKYNHFDPARLILAGLSSGGGGNIAYASLFPKRVAAVTTSDPAFGEQIPSATYQIPQWIANGGQDPRPQPSQVRNYIENVRNLGGDIYQTYNATGGHFSWSQMWLLSDINSDTILTSYWRKAHKAQPVLYFQKSQYCSNEPIAAKMGLTPGFDAYEWQKNNGSGFVTIPGATTHQYTATEPGLYRARYYRALPFPLWSDWSPNPIQISYKTCGTDTLFVEHFDFYGPAPLSFDGGMARGYRNYNDFRQSGLFVTGTTMFTQDAKGQQGGRFMLNHTYPNSSSGTPDQTTPYAVGDIVWRNEIGVPVSSGNDYIFSFYVGNITSITPRVQLVPRIFLRNSGVFVDLLPTNVTPNPSVAVGNASWTKFTYKWSPASIGYNGPVDFYIFNNTAPSTTSGVSAANNGNDFTLDEISFTRLNSPGGVGGMKLWVKPENLTNPLGTNVTVWANAAGGKDFKNTKTGSNAAGLSRPTVSANINADHINFNTVTSFVRSEADSLTAFRGFSGNTSHNAAHVFMVARSNNTTQNHFFLQENQQNLSFNKVEIGLPNNGNITWAAGSLVDHSVNTPFTGADVNKPLLWSFGAGGNTVYIRKNGALANSRTTPTPVSFTGIDGTMQLGEFDGKVAEIIYYLDANIDDAAQSKIESYLALKYGLTLAKGTAQNYIASNGTVFWNGNAAYQNDVFGIGRDDASSLNQLISNSMNTGSGDGMGQSGAGNLVLQKTSAFNNLQFLVIGNDDGALAEQTTDLPAFQTGAKRVGREWKVNNTGSVGSVNLSFNINGLAVSGGDSVTNYAILVDNDGDGNFITGTQTKVNAASIEGNLVRFKNVTLNQNVVFTIVTKAPNVGLPATWVSFTVASNNNTANLNWKTTDEINVSNYVVEYSSNGIDYQGIATVPAYNTSGLNTYSASHNNLVNGTHYYRIRRVDFDGKTGYSDIRVLRTGGLTANGITILTNPVAGKNVLVNITTVQNVRATFSIVNTEGKTVWVQQNNIASGTNGFTMNVGNLPGGVYLLRVKLGEKLVTEKFVKQ
jgi:pimeloyl-ACP methyl ester carboxylesterase